MRMPRFLPSLVLACCSVALPVFSTSAAFAQEKSEAQAVDAGLKGSVDTFWHYAKTFRYDLADAEAKKILEAKPEPGALLKAFEVVSQERKDNLDQWLLRWQQVPELRGSIEQLNAIIAEGYRLRRTNQAAIEGNIRALPNSEQAYAIAISRLRESGEVAVPLMIDYLRDPAKQEYHPVIRRALIDMGRAALSPLVAALEAPVNEANQGMVLTVISAVSEIGYDVSAAPLAYLANNAEAPAVVKKAAADALVKMGAGQAANIDASQLYYEIGQKFYYDKAATSPDGKSNVTFYWGWQPDAGLVKLDVPSAIYGELMAMKAARRSLQVNPKRDDSLSLWLAANYGREVHLPQGAKDPTRDEKTPNAHYFGVASGAQYLNAVLQRAVNDHDTGVALQAIRSLQQIGGESNVFAAGQSEPLVLAMKYPDRLVRFEAAFAAAAALPQTQFMGQERVVPILAEAVAQTGKPHIVVVASEQTLNARVEELKGAGYVAAGVTNAEGAANVALPAVDLLLITDEDAGQVETLRNVAEKTPKLQGAAIVIITKSQASPFAVWSAQNPLITTTQASKTEDLKPVLEQAKLKAGVTPLDEKLAGEYALKATGLLAKLALARGQVLDVTAAKTTLLQALDDARPEIVTESAKVLALLNSDDAQSALLLKATDKKVDSAVRISVYNSLSESAKAYGKLVSEDQVKTLQESVASEASLDIRNAAAEAHGALNLPADQVRSLLLGK